MKYFHLLGNMSGWIIFLLRRDYLREIIPLLAVLNAHVTESKRGKKIK